VPAAPLLAAAPWLLVRGNHESCDRAGQGWWRFLDPRPLERGRDCNLAVEDDVGDFSEPYTVPLGTDWQWIVFDSSKVGLAPLHAWLPDAHAEGPTPISAVLSGLLLNVALYALLRFKLLLAANPNALAPGPLMVTIGLVSLIFAAFMLYRRRDIKRMFAYSSIEHMGIITFAFGIGGPLANFAGLLHMTMHSLTKSAIFFAVGHIAQVKGTQKIADMGGLTVTNPVLG